MLFTHLALASLLAAPSSPAVSIAPASSADAVGKEHGKIAWFQGTYEEALAQAKAQNKLVFIDFWTTWCGWCKRLDKDTFSDDSVAEVMKDYICLSVDAESKTGKPIAARFTIHGYPALMFLLADGSLEDAIDGYRPPDKFKKEALRIRSGKDTVSEYKKLVDADKNDIEKRYRLVQKLEQLGDEAGRDAQMAEIKKLDPEGKSLPMRRAAFDAVIAKINEGFQKNHELDVTAMTSFLEKETLPDILFRGNYALAQMYQYLAQDAQSKGNAAEAKRQALEGRNALKKGWQNVPEDQTAPFGNMLAWAFYEAREDLSPADKSFALEVAEKAVNAAKDDAHTLDTYACCLFMNGKKDEALKQLARCKELDPAGEAWKDRLAEFQK